MYSNENGYHRGYLLPHANSRELTYVMVPYNYYYEVNLGTQDQSCFWEIPNQLDLKIGNNHFQNQAVSNPRSQSLITVNEHI